MMAITRWTKLILAVVGLAAVIRAQETYTVGVIEQAPLVIRAGNGSDSPPTGFIPDVLDEIANSLDVTFRYVWTDTYGSKNPDDTWSGLVGMVMNGEVDIGGAALTITSRRERVLDFSKPYMTSGIAATMAKPEGKSRGPDYFLLFRPFRVAVWVLFVVCFVVFSLCLFLLNKYHPFEHKAAFAEGNSTEKEARGLDLGGSFWLTCTLTLLQGFRHVPRSLAGRLMVLTWAAFALVTVFMYVSALVQVYNFPPAVRSIRLQSVSDIAKKPNVGCGFIGGGSTETFFRASKIAIYEAIYNKAERFPDIETALKRVRADPNFALFMESPALDYEMSRAPCNLYKVGSNLNSVGYAFAFPLDVGRRNIRERVSLILLEMRESAKISKLYQRYWVETGQCGVDKKTSSAGQIKPLGIARPLSVYAYSGVVLMLVLGLVVSAIVGAVEIVLRKRNPRDTGAATGKSSQVI